MPAAKFINVQGKCKWCRHIVPETDPWGQVKWSVELFPTPESLAIIKQLQRPTEDGVLGIKNSLRNTPDGWSMRFARPQNRLYKGQTVAFPPPDARDKDGMPMTHTEIGNGSDVTLKLEVYQHKIPNGKRARSIRWEAIRVDNLVPFTPATDYKLSEEKSYAGLDKAPEQVPNF